MTSPIPIHLTSAGGIVHLDGKFLVLHIKQRDEFVFPKGKLQPPETAEQTAIREIKEETGYQTAIVAPLDAISYEFIEDDGVTYHKTVFHFLLDVVDRTAQPVPCREPHEIASGMTNVWLSFDEALKLLTHPESKTLLQKAQQLLTSEMSAN